MKPRVYNLHTATAKQHGDSVYIGRPTKWGNPFVIAADCTREQAVARFEEYLRANPRLMAAAKRELRGRNLLCYCAPKLCHGHVLLRIANEEDV